MIFQCGNRCFHISFFDRKGNILAISTADRLQNHIDIDILLRKNIKDLKCNTWNIFNSKDCDSCCVIITGHTADLRSSLSYIFFYNRSFFQCHAGSYD